MFELVVADNIVIGDETKALDILLRFLNKKPIQFSSVEVALCCLVASKKYDLWGFDQLVISYLNDSVVVDNVLRVLNNIFPHSSLSESSKNPSAPSQDDLEKDDQSSEEEFNARQNHVNTTQEMFDELAKKIVDYY